MKENTFARRYGLMILAGVVVGAAALILTAAGNPKNMGFCIACFLRDIAGEIRGGVIDADPCCHTEEDSPCRYCDWAPACHFQDGRDGDRLHYILPVKPGEFWQEIEGKEAD